MMRERLGRELRADRRAYPLALLILAVFFVLTGGPAERAVDLFDSEEWVEGRVAILDASFDGAPMVYYETNGTREIGGVWAVKAYDRSGARLFTRRGDGDYPAGPRAGPWTWASFLEGYDDPPRVPLVPFRLCVSYVLTAPSGVVNRSGPYCSNWSDEPISEEEAR